MTQKSDALDRVLYGTGILMISLAAVITAVGEQFAWALIVSAFAGCGVYTLAVLAVWLFSLRR